MIQTIWAGAGSFMDEYYGRKTNLKDGKYSTTKCFKALYSEIEAQSGK
jgi:hypothetical protein